MDTSVFYQVAQLYFVINAVQIQKPISLKNACTAKPSKLNAVELSDRYYHLIANVGHKLTSKSGKEKVQI